MRNRTSKSENLRQRCPAKSSLVRTTRRNIYQRRLLCEPLEDRRLLSVSVPSLNSGILSVGSTSISVQYDGAMLGADLAANYQLQRAGVDGLLGTADDVVAPLTVSYQETTAGNTSALTFAALPEDVYRLTVRDAITDAAGNKIDGNNDSIPGGDWATDFVAVTSDAYTFSNAMSFSSSGVNPSGMEKGDFNGDGNLDLAVTNSSDNTVGILLGNGGGIFSATAFSSGGLTPVDVVAGDFNHDGNLDLVVANNNDQTLGIFSGDGSGGFSAPRIISLSGRYPNSVVTGDFNHDGNLDLAAAGGYGTVEILLGDGNGLFATTNVYSMNLSGPAGLTVGDFNHDDNVDLAVTNQLSDTVGILLGNGNGGFSTATTFSSGGSGPEKLAVADFNGDGNLDLAVTNQNSQTVGILLGNGKGGFVTAATCQSGGIRPYGVVAGNINYDGNLDLAVANADSTVVGILLGNGDGSFAGVRTFSAGGNQPFSLEVGDFNGDELLDLAVTNSASKTVGVLLNTSSRWSVMFKSANGLSFNVAVGSFGTGELIQGSNNAFDGYGRLIVGGVAYRSDNSLYTTEDDGQTIVTGDDTIDGLTVSRKVTVPNTGDEDFARTIDSFTNNTTTAITTTVTIVGNLGSDDDTMVFATSDGDNIVESTDQWIGTDDADGSGTPAIIHYIHGPAGLQPMSVSVIGDNITWTYEITVAAGETVQLASFTIVGTTQADAIAAANALVAPHGELREQAVAFLTTAEQQSLANFGVTNYAPVLTAAVPSLGITNKDIPITVALSAFINNGAGTTTITDVDSSDMVGGIALTGITGNGTWAYSLDGTTFILVDAVSSASALLLPSTAKLRYTPNGKHDETATITFRAWDMTSGISGSKVDTSTNGGISAFSEATDTASLTLDYTPPTVIGTSPSLMGGTITVGTSELSIDFSSGLACITSFDGFELRKVGDDGLLGTTDDTIVKFKSLSNGGHTVTLRFSPLEEGVYRLIVHATNTDYAGNQLDGNGDGIAGGDWFIDFVTVSSDSYLFSTMTSFSSGSTNPWGMTTGDFNGDNKLDLAVLDRGKDTVAVFLGDGSGGFSHLSTFSSGGSWPGSIVAADLNRDGLLDLITLNQCSDTLGIFLGNGDGSFMATDVIRSGGTYATEVICNDFNKDGILDLAVATNGGVSIHLGNGDGSFANTLLYSSGDYAMPDSLTAGDFNGDGNLDLAVTNLSVHNLAILLGDGTGGFSAPTKYSSGGTSYAHVDTADFNGDGNLDIVVTNFNGNAVGILLGDGTGYFGTASSYGCGDGSPMDVKVGDFNHDGKSDLAIANWSGEYVSLLLGNGHGSFSHVLKFACNRSGQGRVVVGDFNGDGASDLAVAKGCTADVGILLNVINPMLVTLDSPHDMPFDVVAGRFGAGELVQGYNNAFDGYGRLIVGGTPFTSPVSYSTTDGGQSIITASSTTAGLAVSRKVTVPNTGDEDFVRTIDSFTNNTDTAITTTVTIVGNLGSDDDTMVFATSDGDTIVETTDQWIGTDDADGSGTPAIIHYIHGPLGLKPASVSVIGDNITWTYEITVAAGETVQFLVLRVLNSAALSLLVVFTTPFQELLRALKIIRTPDVMIVTAALSYKYVFLFARTVVDMHIAKKSRAYAEAPASEERRWVADRMALLFKKTTGRCEAMHSAMVSRGLSDGFKVMQGSVMNSADKMAVAVVCISAGIFIFL